MNPDANNGTTGVDTGMTMSRRYRVRHTTTYRYGASMSDGYTMAYLVPRPTPRQRVVTAEIELDPAPTERDSYLDIFGNLVHQFGLHQLHQHLVVTSNSEVELMPSAIPIDNTPIEQAVAATDALEGELAFDVGFMRGSSPMLTLDDATAAAVRVLADEVFLPGRPVVDALRALTALIFDRFEFDPKFSNISTPLGEVIAQRRGVCQDFAHLGVACARSVGLAARYVSGYIETLPPPGSPRLIGADASHAWCSVWTPLAGWVDFDPTNNRLPIDDHITVAWGRDYGDVTPVRGVMIGPSTTQQLDVSVDVERIDRV